MNQDPTTEEAKWQKRAKLERLGVMVLGAAIGMGSVAFLTKPDLKSLLIGCSAVCVWFILMGLILWKIKIPMNIKTDERERMIRTKSALAGTWAVFYAVLVLGLVVPAVCYSRGIESITIQTKHMFLSVSLVGGLFGVVSWLTRWWLRR